MADTLVALALPPGLYRNGTVYQSKGRWFDANLVRFNQGTVRPVGGWLVMQDDSHADVGAVTGVPRGVVAWRGSAADRILGIGTTSSLYVLKGGVLNDITPVGFVGGTDDSTVPTTGGITGSLYGAGVYGVGLYGAGSATTQVTEATTWQLDSFGDFLVGVSSTDKKLYVWAGNPAVKAAVPAGAPAAPTGVVVTPEGFLVALGWSAGAASSRGLTWASQRTSTVWTPLITNSAGDFDLTTNGRLLGGHRTKSETLLWTDTDMHVMTYIGGPLVYRFAQAGDKCGAISARSPVVVGTTAFWMGHHNFYTYDGFVKPLPCEVQDYVFSDFNEAQGAKVWGMSVSEFGEVWWFYPSASSTETDRYVAYNYHENHWTVGKLRRTAGTDAGALINPVMLSPTGILYEHEVLTHRPGTAGIESAILQENGLGILTESGTLIVEESLFGGVDGNLKPYLESGPVEIGEGDRIMALQRIIPDEKALGDVRATIFASLHPTDPETAYGPYMAAAETSVRVNARQIRIRLDEARDTSWRIGQIRFGGNPSSRR